MHKTTHTHSLTHTLSLSLSLSLSLTHTLSLSLTHSHTHTLSLSLSHTHTLSLSHSHTHTLSLSLSHSHTHTHSLPLPLPQVKEVIINYTTDECVNRANASQTCAEFLDAMRGVVAHPSCTCRIDFKLSEDFHVSSARARAGWAWPQQDPPILNARGPGGGGA